ncbi:MAG: hypothetical protein IPI04_11810 [Ignavibacteria bacterium]|nr:hypothetical protein [Ignavibacteria bacterium]
MSDTTPNNSGSNPEKKSEYDMNTSDKFEFLSAYIDNEIKSAEENETIKKRIESEPDIHNRYTFEKLSKNCIRSRVKRIETPLYIYKNIGLGIEEIIKNNSAPRILNTHSSITTNKNPNLSHPNFTNPNYTNQFQNEKTNLKRYLIYGGYALIALVIMSFAISYYLRSNSELQDNPSFAENDIVSVSRSIFSKVESGQVKTQFNSNNAKELEDSMNKYVDFKVFVPDVKDAELIGGVCNEINGEKLAHFIHKKGNMIIYTLQANLKDVMNHDRIIMCKDFKDNITSGKNWFPCNKDKNNTAVIWFKDNVVCSSVAHMDSKDISAILTNYK